MGKIREPKLVKLICGMLSSEEELFHILTEELEAKFGSIDLKTDIIDFFNTNYYEDEMGSNIKRFFISFTDLIDQTVLVDAKLYTQELESKYSTDNGKRRINLDPGYISEGKLVLGTTKDHQHRLYLGSGIYGEVTLKFKDKTFHSWEWTYPDYKTDVYIEYFIKVRDTLRKQLGRKVNKKEIQEEQK